MSYKFKAKIELIGINPFVFVPENILKNIFRQAGKDKSPIPIRGTINTKPYTQTLVLFRGVWRLYINTSMLKNSPKLIGETIELTVEFDSSDRSIKPNAVFLKALNENKQAKAVFEKLPPSRRNEMVKYIANLKTEESVKRNIQRALDFLTGKGRFVGRDRP